LQCIYTLAILGFHCCWYLHTCISEASLLQCIYTLVAVYLHTATTRAHLLRYLTIRCVCTALSISNSTRVMTRCSALQCNAACCSVLRISRYRVFAFFISSRTRVISCCSVLSVLQCCSVLQRVACLTIQCVCVALSIASRTRVIVCGSVRQCVAACCSVLQRVAVSCSVLQFYSCSPWAW